MDKQDIVNKIGALEEAVSIRIPELETQVALRTKERDEQSEKFKRYEELEKALIGVIPAAPIVTNATGDPQKVNLTVPQYEVSVDVEPVKFNFKKDDMKSQVLYGIYLVRGKRRLGDVKDVMIDKGFKKATDELSGHLQELIAEGLVIFSETNRSYTLTPGVVWHFPEGSEEK